MTEQDERTIYEWAHEELKEKTWELRKSKAAPYLPPTAMWNHRHTARILHHLDMNFAFDVCIPRLEKANVYVSLNEDHVRNGWLLEPVTGYGDEPIQYWDIDFYTALLAYIKGNPHA